MKRPSSWMCLCVAIWLKQKFALQFPGFVPSCVCPRLSLRFSRFYSAGVAESQKDLESLTGEVSEMEKQVQLAGESRKKENDKFSRFYFAGGARTFGASCANEDTHHWLCKRTCRHAMGTVVCSLGANTNIIFFNPVSLAHRLSDAFATITNGQQTLKNEMSNMTSQVCLCSCVCVYVVCSTIFGIMIPMNIFQRGSNHQPENKVEPLQNQALR